MGSDGGDRSSLRGRIPPEILAESLSSAAIIEALEASLLLSGSIEALEAFPRLFALHAASSGLGATFVGVRRGRWVARVHFGRVSWGLDDYKVTRDHGMFWGPEPHAATREALHELLEWVLSEIEGLKSRKHYSNGAAFVFGETPTRLGGLHALQDIGDPPNLARAPEGYRAPDHPPGSLR